MILSIDRLHRAGIEQASSVEVASRLRRAVEAPIFVKLDATVEKWDSDSDSDTSDEEDLTV